MSFAFGLPIVERRHQQNLRDSYENKRLDCAETSISVMSSIQLMLLGAPSPNKTKDRGDERAIGTRFYEFRSDSCIWTSDRKLRELPCESGEGVKLRPVAIIVAGCLERPDGNRDNFGNSTRVCRKKDSETKPNEVRSQERRVLHKTCQDRILKRRFKYLDGLQRCERPHDGWRLIRNVRLAR